MTGFVGQTYWYNTPNDGRREIGVLRDIGGMWIVCWKNDHGSNVRIRSSSLQPHGSSSLARHMLSIWADKHLLERANYYSEIEGEKAMAKVKKPETPDVQIAECIAIKIEELVDQVLVRNITEIERIRQKLLGLDEPEGVTLSFSVSMSPERFPTVEVKVSYSERHKDALASPVDDPTQGKLNLS